MITIPPRIVRTTIGPAGGAGYRFEDEHQEFTVKGFRSSKPNECTVKIENLSKATIGFLEQKDLVLMLEAGETVPGALFRGSVQPRGVTTDNSLPKRVTEIKAVDGRRLWRDAKAAVSYPPGIAVAGVVQDLLKIATLQGFAVAPGNVYPTDAFPAGYYYVGRWRDALTEILWPRGYVWTIQDRTIYVGLQTALNPGTVPLISPTTGLIGSPKRTAKGVDFECKLDPRVRPGWGVQLQSDFVTGLFRVVVREHEGDNRGIKWLTKAQCEKVK